MTQSPCWGEGRGSLSRPLPSSLPHLVLSLTCLMQNHLWGSSSAGHMRSHAALSTAARGRPTMNEGLNGEWTPGPFQSAPSSLPRLPSGFWGLARHLPQVPCSLWASFSSHTNFKIYLLLFTVYTRSFTLTVSSDPQSPARGARAPVLQWRTLHLGGGTVHRMGQQGSRTQRRPPQQLPPWAHVL